MYREKESKREIDGWIASGGREMEEESTKGREEEEGEGRKKGRPTDEPR